MNFTLPHCPKCEAVGTIVEMGLCCRVRELERRDKRKVRTKSTNMKVKRWRWDGLLRRYLPQYEKWLS